MRALRSFVALAMFVAVASTAQAQPWGGGGPGVSQPARSPHAAPYTSRQFPWHAPDAAAPASRQFTSHHNRLASGGSWDGSRPGFGGSPPVSRGPRTDLREFFGYVAPRGTVVAPRAEPQPPQRTTRDAYLERYRKP